MEAEDTGQAALPVRSAAGPEVLEEACPAVEARPAHGDLVGRRSSIVVRV